MAFFYPAVTFIFILNSLDCFLKQITILVRNISIGTVQFSHLDVICNILRPTQLCSSLAAVPFRVLMLKVLGVKNLLLPSLYFLKGESIQCAPSSQLIFGILEYVRRSSLFYNTFSELLGSSKLELSINHNWHA